MVEVYNDRRSSILSLNETSTTHVGDHSIDILNDGAAIEIALIYNCEAQTVA